MYYFPNEKSLRGLPAFYETGNDSILKDGCQLLFNKEGKIDKELYFKRNKPVGVWKVYHYDNNVYATVDYLKNVKVTYYCLDTDQLYTGTLGFEYQEDNEIRIVEIKNGDIQKIEFRDLAGKQLRTLKFKKGYPQK